MPDLSNIDVIDTVDVYDVSPLLPKALGNVDVISGAEEVTPPVVTPVSPVGPALSTSTPIVFDVTDNGALGRVVVHAAFAELGLEEVVHNGDRFAPFYAASSSRTPIDGGWRYSVVRRAGWPSSPVINVIARDAAGAEA